jgi:DtxR family Mn-dependent transcriptional regulator
MTASRRISRRQEDYLEAVLALVEAKGAARVRDLAAGLNVSKPSVTAALRQLARRGLVQYQAYEWVRLTPRGKVEGRKVRRRHVALEAFLTDVLGVETASARANACRMEHVVDDDVLARFNRLAEFIGRRRAGHPPWLDRFNRYCRREERA